MKNSFQKLFALKRISGYKHKLTDIILFGCNFEVEIYNSIKEKRDKSERNE